IRDWSVTGVQTCALPISDDLLERVAVDDFAQRRQRFVAHRLEIYRNRRQDAKEQSDEGDRDLQIRWPGSAPARRTTDATARPERSEERRVGKECRCAGRA